MKVRRDGNTAPLKRPLIGRLAALRATLGRYLFASILSALTIAAIIVFLSPYIFVAVPAGYFGVIFRPWGGGTVTNSALKEGNNFVLPWNRVSLYDTRIQIGSAKFEAITKDDLHIKVVAKYRYRTRAETLGLLHKLVGPEYRYKLLEPAISSAIRSEISKYSAVDVYGSERNILQKKIYDKVVSPLNRNFVRASTADAAAPEGQMKKLGRIVQVDPHGNLIELMDVLITEVTLPQSIRAAIERKEEAVQLTEEYQYRILKEELESKRKEIEGRGIAAFQREVQAEMTPSYLKWRGIEATLSLAQSQNSKVVIVGGANGLPLIFNTDDAANAATKVPGKLPSGAKK
jgi:regulator of protease activity HflC (stomatin/prohibitin superfamily)